jgi:hypothetical protein
MKRRAFLVAAVLAAAGGVGAGLAAGAGPRVRARRWQRRRVRRRVRRRHRRRVAARLVAGRRVWVVPVGLAVGWELAHDGRVVVVRETRIVERDGDKVEIVVVADPDGKTEEIEIVREDTEENSVELEGSEIPGDDGDTPGIEIDDEDDIAIEDESP